jgi:hypothetical protein
MEFLTLALIITATALPPKPPMPGPMVKLALFRNQQAVGDFKAFHRTQTMYVAAPRGLGLQLSRFFFMLTYVRSMLMVLWHSKGTMTGWSHLMTEGGCGLGVAGLPCRSGDGQ